MDLCKKKIDQLREDVAIFTAADSQIHAETEVELESDMRVSLLAVAGLEPDMRVTPVLLIFCHHSRVSLSLRSDSFTIFHSGVWSDVSCLLCVLL